MKRPGIAALMAMLASTLLLSACGSAPPVPHWQANAASLMGNYQADWLEGREILARREFALAVRATAATGDPARVARLYLVQCALRRAALDWSPCAHDAAAPSAPLPPQEAAYARFLDGDWAGVQDSLLPPQYAALPGLDQAHADRIYGALAAIADPLSRLIAASVALKRGQGDARTLRLASDTAAQQGWRRPLLAWLKLRLAEARERNDAGEAALLAQRIRLVESSFSPNFSPKE